MGTKIVLILVARTREAFSFEVCNEGGLEYEAVLVANFAAYSGKANHILFGRNGMLAYYSIPFVICLTIHSPCLIHFIRLVNLCCTEIFADAHSGREHGVY